VTKKKTNMAEQKDFIRWQQSAAQIEEKTKEKSKHHGNISALKHGIFASRILTPEEKELFDILVEKLYGDFQFNKSSDFLQVELIGVYSVKLMRAQMAGDTDAAERLDRMIRAHMRELKTTKIAREGEQPQQSQTSPAEWASALLDKAAEVTEKTQSKKTASKKKPETIADNTGEPEEGASE